MRRFAFAFAVLAAAWTRPAAAEQYDGRVCRLRRAPIAAHAGIAAVMASGCRMRCTGAAIRSSWCTADWPIRTLGGGRSRCWRSAIR